MAYKVAIDAAFGGTDSGASSNNLIEKDFSLSISKYISNRLNDLGIENFLVRNSDETLSNEERVNIIKNNYGSGNNVIIISNRLNTGGLNGAEIMYPLRSNSKLASLIANNLEDMGQPVLKYYQLRDSSDTSKDDDYLIRNTANNLTIVIDYGYIDNKSDANFLKNNYEKLGEAVVKAIANYAGVNYTPLNMEGYYIVKNGDSLWSIASKNDTTVDNIKRLNNLTNNTLQIGQILKLNNEEKEDNLKDKNIYFVSISVDTNKKTWENMVKKDQLGGIQLHCGKNPKFMDDYDIPGIPRFILIDPEGRFCGARVGHPSTPGWGEYLAELVK